MTYKGIKVIDVGCDPEDDVQFGTCELCFSYGWTDNPFMVLEFPDGKTAQIDTYWWEWGDYREYGVDNVVDFSAWLSEQELSEEEYSDLRKGYSEVLVKLIEDYNYRVEETDDSL
ncbi:hypothetical protein ACEE67_01820 [Streptococcus thoraltensis]